MATVAKVFKTSRTSALPYIQNLHSESEDIDYFSNIVFPENTVYIAVDKVTQKILGLIAFDDEWVDHLYIFREAGILT